MLRGDNVACISATSGTGPFNLVALPGATDIFTYLTSWQNGGPGFGTNSSIVMLGSIIEFTDNTFTTISQIYSGLLTVSIGANLGATTVAQTSMQTASNPTGASYNDHVPGSITVGVAGNTLISLDMCSWAHVGDSPYFDQTTGGVADNAGICVTQGGLAYTITSDTSGDDWFTWFRLRKPIYAKRVGIAVATGAGAVTSNAFGRIYQVGSNGRPGKLLFDYGQLGTAGSSLNTSTTIVKSALMTGVFLPPGEYFFNLQASWSGGSPTLGCGGTNIDCAPLTKTRGVMAGITIATGGSSTAPDPANTTGYAIGAGANEANFLAVFLNNA